MTERTPQPSEHREYRQNLAALAAGRLAGAARERLVDHVSTCESCAAILDTAREVADVLERRGEQVLAPHPRVESLREHAGGMGPQEREGIRVHLEHCDSCKLEVAAWRRRLEAAPHGAASTDRDRTARRALVAAGLVAAGIVLGLLGRPWLERGAVNTWDVGAWSGPARSLIVHPVERGEAADERILLEREQSVLPVTIYFNWLDAPGQLGPLEARVRELGGAEVWSTTITAEQASSFAAASDPITLFVPGSRLAGGRYELSLSRTHDRDPAPLVLRRFELTRP